MTTYTYEEAFADSFKYFGNDELAAGVFLNKHALRNDKAELTESNPDQMHRRLSKEFARIENNFPNPLTEKEIYEYLAGFKYLVPQGSPMSAIGNPWQIQSISNCFTINSPLDSYCGILHSDQELVQIMKRRGGVGLDISNLRPKNTPTRNAARTSDGIGVFMERYSNSCREVAQNGRRGAEMQTCSVDHPEISTFINIKKDRKKVTGANVSVRFTDKFMQSVLDNTDHVMKWPVDSENPKIIDTVPARKIWDEFVTCAWESAEPGALFWDTILKWSPADIYSKFGFKSISTNPCVTGDTIVETDNGPQRVLDLVGKPFVARFKNGDSPSDHRGFWLTGYKRTLKFTTVNGIVLKCTPEHPIMTLVISADGTNALKFKLAQDIEPGEILVLSDGFCNKYSSDAMDGIVKSVENGEIEEVYDCSIPSVEMFLANGIYVKNCSELILSAYDSCRLLCANVYSFVIDPFTKDAKFDWAKFKKAAQIGQRLMDDMVEIEIEQIDKILDKVESDPEPDNIKQVEKDLWIKIRKACVNGRRTGLGVTGIGDAVAAIGLRYGSPESISFVSEVYRNLCIESYRSSCIMAGERGAFPVFDASLEKGHPFIEQVLDQDVTLRDLYNKNGRRNIANLTTAPAGSVSVETQTTSGIEGAFLIFYWRFKKINPNDKNARVDRIDAMGDKWQKFPVFHHGFKKWAEVNGVDLSQIDPEKIKDVNSLPCYKDSPYYKATSADVDWEAGVELQAAAQKWVDHAISKTCNLPKDATKELVSKVYLKAWKSGCKGFTVYRDGCRDGVLVSNASQKEQGINKTTAPKRPKSLPCDIHHTKFKGEDYFVLVSLIAGLPYEVFAGESKKVTNCKSGNITKNKRGHYTLVGDDGSTIENVCDLLTDEEAVITRMISLSLRHGSDIKYIVEQLEKSPGSMSHFGKALSRALKKYIPDGEKVTGESCPTCGSLVIREGGCKTCKNCGWSACN